MLNAEKWKKEILDITEGGYYFAVSKDRQNIARSCDGLKCKNCIFDEEDDHDCGCNFSRMKWMLSEYKEHIKLTRLEYDILKYLSDNTKHMYIVRNKDGKLCIFDFEPVKNKVNDWWSGRYMYGMVMFNKLFQFVQWEDSTPTLIKDVLENCEVVNDAEE